MIDKLYNEEIIDLLYHKIYFLKMRTAHKWLVISFDD